MQSINHHLFDKNFMKLFKTTVILPCLGRNFTFTNKLIIWLFITKDTSSHFGRRVFSNSQISCYL